MTQTVAFQTGVPQTYFGNRSRIETGYAYGGGVEYALPTDSFLNFFKSNAVTVKAEYIRYDLGSRNLLVASTAVRASATSRAFAPRAAWCARGLNFKFGTF